LTGRFDLVVRNGDVAAFGAVHTLDIGIRDGRIASLSEAGLPSGGGTPELDATGLVVLPGGIDTHTHVRWPYDQRRTADDFGSATRAAALTGTTTIVDFVPPAAGTALLDACVARVEEALADDPVIDFALHPILASADPRTVEQLGAVIEQGFTSFKMYTTYADRRIDDGAAWTLMGAIAAHGGLPGFHAENHELIRSATSRQAATGDVSPADFPASRPALAEAEAIQMVSLFARRLGTPVWIYHVSGAEALDAIRAARAAGSRVFAETCTHYLTLDDSVFSGPDPWRYVISPPIRSAADRDALWAGVADGAITAVGSDHCAYATGEKAATPGDHRTTPAGAPGIEARTPFLWYGAVERRGLGVATMARVSAESAARALGLYPRKGVVQVGSDADLVLWDRAAAWSADQLRPASDETFSLYAGMAGTGLPRHVLVGGEPVVTDGALVGGRGRGRFLRRGRPGAMA
jgi:dihydropyrimidinase